MNDGTVEVRNLRINVSVLKVIDGIEVFVTELDSEVPSIRMMSEKKFTAIEFHDDQNEKYILIVQISFEASGKTIDKSYTHHIDDPYMNIYFKDRVSELAL